MRAQISVYRPQTLKQFEKQKVYTCDKISIFFSPRVLILILSIRHSDVLSGILVTSEHHFIFQAACEISCVASVKI